MKKVNCILLVDDDESDNFFHELVIREADVCNELKVVTDGSKALDYIMNTENEALSADYPKPDIIFLDINMPRMNGFEFLDEYSNLQLKQKQSILITMLTTSQNSRDHQKAMEYEVVSEFKNKPLTKEMLQEIVQKYF